MANKAWENAIKAENLGSTIGAVGSGVTGILSAGAKNAQTKDTSAIDDSIAETAGTEFGYNDYDSLQNSFNLGALQGTGWGGRNFRTSDGERAMNTLSGVVSGASAGATIGGPIGAAIGGVVGLGSGLIGMISGNRKAKREAARLNEEAEEANNRYLANFANNAENIGQRNFNSALLNLAAFGGMLKSNNIDNFDKSKVRLAAFGGGLYKPYESSLNFDNGVTMVEEGDSHEQNPFGGVLMGVDPQGVPNLVEQGEVIFNDYVFSNRLSPTEEQLENVKLPKRFAGKPFSYIAEKVQEESEMRPLDSISRNTLIDSMMKLTTLQEEQRQRDEEYNAFETLENTFADGGDININIKSSKRGTFTTAAKRRGMSVQEFASKVLANPDKYSESMRKKAQFAHNAKSWAHACGGKLKLHAFGGPQGNVFAGPGREENYIVNPETGDWILDNANNTVGYTVIDGELVPTNTTNPGLSVVSDATGTRVSDNDTNNSLSWLRFAPVVGSGIQALSDAFGWSNRDDYTNPNIINQARTAMRNVSSRPLGNRVTFRPFDLDYEQNRLQNASLATTRGLLDTAGGNREIARNAMLVNNANLTGNLGGLYRQAREYNDARRSAVEQFNAGIDQFNAQQGLQADIYNQRRDEQNAELAVREAMLRDNIQSALSGVRSNNITNFWNQLGNLGTDRTYADMARWFQENVAPYNDTTRRYRSGYDKGGKMGRVKEFKKK